MNTVSMTYPQWLRQEASIGRLSTMDHRLLTLLLLSNPKEFVSSDEIIEVLWPDADAQALTANNRVRTHIFNLRQAGVPVETRHGWGWRIPEFARSSSQV